MLVMHQLPRTCFPTTTGEFTRDVTELRLGVEFGLLLRVGFIAFIIISQRVFYFKFALNGSVSPDFIYTICSSR
jgi:hypothetical protein